MVEANDFNDTLGAGSYPEPPEEKSKLYVFKINCTCEAEVEVQAESQEEAEEILKNANQYDLKYEHSLEIERADIEEIKSCEVLELV